MKIKRKEVYAFYNVVGNAQFEMPIKTGFRYMLSKNLKKCKTEMETTDDLFPIPKEYEEYLKMRQHIFSKFGIKLGNNGAVDIRDVKALGEEKEIQLNDELGKLLENSKEVLEQVTTLTTEKMKFIEEEVEIDFEKAKIDDIPTISEKEENHWDVWRLLELIAIQ